MGWLLWFTQETLTLFKINDRAQSTKARLKVQKTLGDHKKPSQRVDISIVGGLYFKYIRTPSQLYNDLHYHL